MQTINETEYGDGLPGADDFLYDEAFGPLPPPGRVIEAVKLA